MNGRPVLVSVFPMDHPDEPLLMLLRQVLMWLPKVAEWLADADAQPDEDALLKMPVQATSGALADMYELAMGDETSMEGCETQVVFLDCAVIISGMLI